MESEKFTLSKEEKVNLSAPEPCGEKAGVRGGLNDTIITVVVFL